MGKASSKTRQSENLNFSVISMKGTDEPAESCEEGMFPQSLPYFSVGLWTHLTSDESLDTGCPGSGHDFGCGIALGSRQYLDGAES